MFFYLIWLRVKADGRFIIFCAIYIPPESSSYNEEDTWCVLEDEKRKFSIQFPSDLFCLMGDFNGYVGVTPEVLISPYACADEAAWQVWDDLVIHLPPRVSKDHSRRKNNWRRKILDFCGNENFVILNGRVGKAKSGEKHIRPCRARR